MEPIITFTARLIEKATGQPLSSDGTMVKLYDKDIFEDDFLGQSQADESGYVTISFLRSDFSSADSPGEKFPDLYFTVFKYGKLLFKSALLKNFDIDRFSEMEASKGQKIDLGTFVIE